MAKGSRKQKRKASHTEPTVVTPMRELELELFGPDPLAQRLRGLIGGFITDAVAAELDEVLHAGRYQRIGSDGEEARRGYRHTWRTRDLTTSFGPSTIRVQRARLFDADGAPSEEWQSTLVPRYARRMRAVDDAILGTYLAGANSRRIRGALRPLLADAPLSKSAISRVVPRLKQAFEAWRTERLDAKPIVYLFLDAIAVNVRVDGAVQSTPILVALGVTETGEKELLGLQLMASESTAAWKAMVEDLVARGLRAPLLCIIDGNAGLRRAVGETWPQAHVQRCVVHKLRNLEAHCPKRAVHDLRDDFHAITEAKSLAAAEKAYAAFIASWQRRCPGVARSLAEAGKELLTFFRFPRAQWKCLRTTNAIERLHEEFRRRIKTQASLPTEASVLYLFHALYASGQIRMRRIDGWQQLVKVIAAHQPTVLTRAA
jgi:putative transposase